MTLPENFDLRRFGERYAESWCNGDPSRVASFFSLNGCLRVNEDAPAVGRSSVQQVAAGFMTAFPDLVLTMDDVRIAGEVAEFHWTFTGTNTGPGGTGNKVRFSGFESWTIGEDGLILQSQGRFDAEDYRRQLAR
ncbi:MAG TPA: ester cyclase [Bryobacteraceae bacterium]|nr:ester cyclase [Bryobacteraceae bacterium]